MGRVKRKRRQKRILIIVIEIICLIAAGFGVYKVIDARLTKIHNQKTTEQTETDKPDKNEWNLLLVNQWHAIPDDFEVTTTEVEDGYEVDERVADALNEMLADCREAGYSPQIISAFRTRETQEYLYDHTSNKSDTALPGHSEHECGLAVDIIDADSAGWADPLIDEQEDMPAQEWLMEHCQDYGFILRYPKDKEEITAIIYEPWHYRYVGKKHAKAIMKKGICLEEYLGEDD